MTVGVEVPEAEPGCPLGVNMPEDVAESSNKNWSFGSNLGRLFMSGLRSTEHTGQFT